MSVQNNALTIGGQLAAALGSLQARGLPFVATPAALRLEHDLVPFGGDDAGDRDGPSITHLEGPHLSIIPIPPAPPGRPTWRVRYFLDGVQRTLPIGWCGMNALALVVVVSGVIERRPQDGVFRAVPGMTRIAGSVIIASAPNDEHAFALADAFARTGLDVQTADPSPGAPPHDGDFLALQARFRPVVSAVREACEYEALKAWIERTDGSEGWLVMDGSLSRADIGNAVGLIKRHSRFDLTNGEMTDLLHMPVGHRSSAFQRAVSGGLRPITWYLRLHEATGADPLFGLARIEAPSQNGAPGDLDALSCLIFSERTPRATNDDRWPTLLYPIHIAERILKVKLERALLGVPAALRRSLREVA
ncbi:MAG: hypothetical protein ACYDAR_05665 [Thermomicrobiales bacterium]